MEGGWLRMLGTKAGPEDLMYVKSWEGVKRWVAKNWDIVIDAAVSRLGEEVRGELKALRDKLNDNKIAREIVAPALLLMQAEKLGVNEKTLRCSGAVISGTIGGDGHVSAAIRVVGLTSGMHEVALLWAAVFAAHSIKTKAENARSVFKVAALGGDAARLAGLYFLHEAPLLEGDDRLKSHKLAEAVKLGAEGLDIRWEGLRRTEGERVAADLTVSAAGVAVKYNVYLRRTRSRSNSSRRTRAMLSLRRVS